MNGLSHEVPNRVRVREAYIATWVDAINKSIFTLQINVKTKGHIINYVHNSRLYNKILFQVNP